jgi:hypothetical protein
MQFQRLPWQRISNHTAGGRDRGAAAAVAAAVAAEGAEGYEETTDGRMAERRDGAWRDDALCGMTCSVAAAAAARSESPLYDTPHPHHHHCLPFPPTEPTAHATVTAPPTPAAWWPPPELHSPPPSMTNGRAALAHDRLSDIKDAGLNERLFGIRSRDNVTGQTSRIVSGFADALL